MPLVSIIVPVYKAEKWLHRCVDSILAQTMEDFELLLIDDGSPDRSGEICDEYAAKDSRVRVFHKENGGVSSARNLGLDNAQGEWISFVDADDWVEVDYLAGLTEHLDADFITGGMRDSQGYVNLVDGRLYENKDVSLFISSYNIGSCFVRTVWGKLLKRRIISENNLRFNLKIRYGEDTIFNKNYLNYCCSVRVINSCGYRYYSPIGESIQEKYKLSLDEIDYICSVINEINLSLTKKFQWSLDDGELKREFFQLIKLDNIFEVGIDRYCLLCQKYYFTFTKNQILADSFMSPIVKGLVKIKLLYNQKNYIGAKLCYNQIAHFCKDLPWIVNFQYADFYLWYLLIKCRMWWVLDKMLKVYYKIKK